MPPDRRRGLALVAAAAILAGGLVLALMPARVLEGLPSLCLWHRIGLPCWGCGSVRALAALLHGDIYRAWAHNHNVAVTAPLLAGLMVRNCIQALRRG